jgi:hypothetical protein
LKRNRLCTYNEMTLAIEAKDDEHGRLGSSE